MAEATLTLCRLSRSIFTVYAVSYFTRFNQSLIDFFNHVDLRLVLQARRSSADSWRRGSDNQEVGTRLRGRTEAEPEDLWNATNRAQRERGEKAGVGGQTSDHRGCLSICVCGDKVSFVVA